MDKTVRIEVMVEGDLDSRRGRKMIITDALLKEVHRGYVGAKAKGLSVWCNEAIMKIYDDEYRKLDETDITGTDELKWTHDFPTEHGTYWTRWTNIHPPRVAVIKGAMGHAWVEDEPVRMTSLNQSATRSWYGPIEPPSLEDEDRVKKIIEEDIKSWAKKGVQAGWTKVIAHMIEDGDLPKYTDTDNNEDLTEMINSHWGYVKGVMEGKSFTVEEYRHAIEYHYRTAFRHGHKHAMSDCARYEIEKEKKKAYEDFAEAEGGKALVDSCVESVIGSEALSTDRQIDERDVWLDVYIEQMKELFERPRMFGSHSDNLGNIPESAAATAVEAFRKEFGEKEDKPIHGKTVGLHIRGRIVASAIALEEMHIGDAVEIFIDHEGHNQARPINS